SILFSDRETDPEEQQNPTGSMTDYYFETSYGTFHVTGDVIGWYRMSKNYSYYVGSDDGLTNGRVLAKDALVAAYMDGVDFSVYDQNNDGLCDGLIIIHAGPGAETGMYGIWSHKGNFNEVEYDNVKFSAYTMNPEEQFGLLSPIGVICHEYGHFLGLPDLYDIDYEPATSQGLGCWTIMATGNYNGNGRIPAHFDAWCKAKIGFMGGGTVRVSENLLQAEIPCIEYNPVSYLLQNSRTGSREYWLVENRQRVGFDAALPGAGLCIYHVDLDAPPQNTNYLRYYVALEQADGKNQLALAGSQGDDSDPWPGRTNNRNFNDMSVPDSKTNELGVTHGISSRIGVWDISDCDSLMYADLDIEWSRPYVTLAGDNPFLFDDSPPGGNGDGNLDPGESISFYATATNLMRVSFNARARLSTANQDVTFITDEVDLALVFKDEVYSNTEAIQFTLSPNFVPVIDSFFLTITSDSVGSLAGSDTYTTTFGFEVDLGPPQVLIVDDDRGKDYQEAYVNAVYNQRIPHTVWSKSTHGTPSGEELAKYRMVFWHTGDPASGVLNAGDIDAMKYYLDQDGNLLLSTLSGALDIDALDPAFMSDYLGATLEDGTGEGPRFAGVAGNEVGDGTNYMYDNYPLSLTPIPLLTPAGAGEAAITSRGGTCGISYRGTHSSVFLTFPIEYLKDAGRVYTKDTLIARVMNFFGGIPTDIDDGRVFAPLPKNFDLSQNYPNPFNPVTTISYTVRPTSESLPKTNLSVFNMLGQRVTTLVDRVQLPGKYSVVWDGSNSHGQPVATGVYFYRLTRGDDSESRKMILLK
ncbi:MAG: M6 family metalloprotease domain-containing protein, partial [candidate division Zixibacteria bacterium]|nr:M6 family metalloprotease domain-containing protein [candidate division Zixibacteria bacterium]